MPVNFSDALGLQTWALIIIAVVLVWYWRRSMRLASAGGDAPAQEPLLARLHRLLLMHDRAGYAIVCAYILTGTYFGLQFFVRYWVQCTSPDCGYTFLRMLERIVLWPYYAWLGGVA